MLRCSLAEELDIIGDREYISHGRIVVNVFYNLFAIPLRT